MDAVHRITAAAALAIALLGPGAGSAPAQSLARPVVAGGAVNASLDGPVSLRVRATVGQVLVGHQTAYPGGSTAETARFGFWVGRTAPVPTGAADFREAIPLFTALHPNAPNPFRAHTDVRFSLAHDGRVHIPVYDVGGRRVATILDGWQSAGRHAVRFDARGLSAGVYFYRLEADGIVETRRFLLLK